jgi:hypothetical protein
MSAFIHTAAVAIGRALAKAGSLLLRLQERVAQARAERTRIEFELFHGCYHLSSKNDDDLPLVN